METKPALLRGRPLLIVLGLLFVGGFWYLRATSPFLRIERDEETAAIAADWSGLSIPEVMALRGIYEYGGDQKSLNDAASALLKYRQEYGRDELAVLIAIGRRELVDELLREADGDADAAAAALAVRPEGLLAVRFEKDAERYASRR